MPEITLIPDEKRDNTGYYNEEHNFAFYQAKNKRPYQEDTLAWYILSRNELSPAGTEQTLSPLEIGARLWTSYHLLDAPHYKAGSTASTVVSDGQGNLITATLGDAVSFAVLYSNEGTVSGVTRLNSVTHKPNFPDEFLRIRAAGGFVVKERALGILAISRALGDYSSAFSLRSNNIVCSDARIDITNISTLLDKHSIKRENLKEIQIITTSDGFTDGAGTMNQNNAGHEHYLMQLIKNAPSQHLGVLSQYLVDHARSNISVDNITVGVQQISEDTPPLLLGVYDGHSGAETSSYAATNIATIFKHQCSLTREQYEEQALSVHNNKLVYTRDHPESALFLAGEKPAKKSETSNTKKEKSTRRYTFYWSSDPLESLEKNSSDDEDEFRTGYGL